MLPKTFLQGKVSHQARSLGVLLRTVVGVLARRAVQRPLVPGWSMTVEMGTLFWRAQFQHAFALRSIRESRAYLDSLYSVLQTQLDVQVRPSQGTQPRGDWFIPRTPSSDTTMLYFHGGGYAFYTGITRHFIAVLADTLGIAIFAPDYRLTPEHPHPAQLDDGLAAYAFLLEQGMDPQRLVIGGDSAGGHLALMLLPRLRAAPLPQPALAIALSPWIDMGRRGASQFGNDCYDVLQGYQTLRYGQWLKGATGVTDAELCPIHQNFHGLAPVYLQAGGKEVLVDMIRDFAHSAKHQGAQVRLDVWEHMTHEFHLYGDHAPESREALGRVQTAIRWARQADGHFPSTPCTEVDTFV